jgi:hypothetical protein
LDDHARAHLLHAADDHQLPGLQALLDRPPLVDASAGGDAPLPDPVLVVDDQHVAAVAILLHRQLRHHRQTLALLLHLYAARLYEIDTWHPRAPVAAVQAGSAKLLMDTAHPDPSIDLEELVPDLFVD